MPEPKRPLKVFLSYASQDKLVVRELSGRLAGEGWIDPWVDEKKLLPGQDWRTKIEEAVETSDIVIICLSSNSVSKEGFVQKELRYAREIAFEKPDETIFLIPLRLDDCTVPRGLRFYQWGDYFGEQADETYGALIESLKLRYEQKLKIEEDLARREKEKQDREAAEKAAREMMEREAAEKAAREKEEFEAVAKAAREKEKHEAERERMEKAARVKLERETEEKVRREKAEREATERANREKAKREAAAKVQREKAEYQAARKAALTESLSTWFITLKSNLPRAKSLLRITGIIGIIIVLFWASSWVIPKFVSLIPTAEASFTPAFMATEAITNSPIPLIKTMTPSATSAKSYTPTSASTLTTTPLPTEISDAKGVQMVLVPAGEFTMGENALGDSDQHPAHEVYLDAFYIDYYEVTNAIYKSCVDASMCKPPQESNSYTRSTYFGNSEFDNYPVINVDWNMAKTFCEWRGTHLPTEAQWEKAARGTDGRIYPWGENTDSSICNYANITPNYGFSGCNDDTTAVGSYEIGKSPYDAYDMAGNIWEWVADWYQDDYYASLGQNVSNPQGPLTGKYRVLRGQSWHPQTGLDIYGTVTSVRWKQISAFVSNNIGFRCAQNATEVSNVESIVSTESPIASDMTALPLPTEITDAKGVSMVLVSAGEFTMGSDSINDDEMPIHTVNLDDFYIDKYEVSNALYKACVDSGNCTLPTDKGRYQTSFYADYPVDFVDWNKAKAYCEWRGARLPSEAEWEKAARGTDGRLLPWGEYYQRTYSWFNLKIDCNRANFDRCEADLMKVGSYENGKSPYGVYDLIGNVSEWVADWYSATYYQFSPTSNPLGPDSGTNRVVRGSSWQWFIPPGDAASRGTEDPLTANAFTGFRCARSAQ